MRWPARAVRSCTRRPASASGRAITGWYAEFEDLTLPPGSVGYAKDATRWLGATFDPSALYRFNAVQRMLGENGLTTRRISGHVRALQEQLLAEIAGTPMAGAELLNPLDDNPHARFLAFRSPSAQSWYSQLRRTAASPTYAATCFASVSAFTRTKRTWSGWRNALGG